LKQERAGSPAGKIEPFVQPFDIPKRSDIAKRFRRLGEPLPKSDAIRVSDKGSIRQIIKDDRLPRVNEKYWSCTRFAF